MIKSFIVIFSGDKTLRILLINPFKDYVEAVFSPTGCFILFRATSILNRLGRCHFALTNKG